MEGSWVRMVSIVSPPNHERWPHTGETQVWNIWSGGLGMEALWGHWPEEASDRPATRWNPKVEEISLLHAFVHLISSYLGASSLAGVVLGPG